MIFCDETERMDAKRRSDDGSDEQIISSRVAESMVMNGIENIAKIDPDILLLDLKEGAEEEKLTFQRTCNNSCIVS